MEYVVLLMISLYHDSFGNFEHSFEQMIEQILKKHIELHGVCEKLVNMWII